MLSVMNAVHNARLAAWYFERKQDLAERIALAWALSQDWMPVWKKQ